MWDQRHNMEEDKDYGQKCSILTQLSDVPKLSLDVAKSGPLSVLCNFNYESSIVFQLKERYKKA